MVRSWVRFVQSRILNGRLLTSVSSCLKRNILWSKMPQTSGNPTGANDRTDQNKNDSHSCATMSKPSSYSTLMPTDLQNSPTIAIPKCGLPVTIITGFLGSGKTTLLNQILQNAENLKTAVLVNEFGDIDIDSQLLVSIDKDMVELSNGCICCTINDDLIQAVYRILERSDRVDYLIVETTGVADPLPIILTFLGTDLRNLTRLDSVITLIDGADFTSSHFESAAALNQVVYGDILIINKIDLATDTKIRELEAWISTLKEDARIFKTDRAQVPLPLILDIAELNANAYAHHLNKSQHRHSHDHHDGHHHSHVKPIDSNHLENDGFMSVAFKSEQPFSVHQFQAFLDSLPPTVFRGKGILWFKESYLRHIFQLSGKRCSLETDRKSPHGNQLILIGRDLDPDNLTQRLKDCLWKEPATVP